MFESNGIALRGAREKGENSAARPKTTVVFSSGPKRDSPSLKAPKILCLPRAEAAAEKLEFQVKLAESVPPRLKPTLILLALHGG